MGIKHITGRPSSCSVENRGNPRVDAGKSGARVWIISPVIRQGWAGATLGLCAWNEAWHMPAQL